MRKTIEEKEFYLRSAIRNNWSKQELLNQLKRGVFERTMLADYICTSGASFAHKMFLEYLRTPISLILSICLILMLKRIYNWLW